MTSQASSFAPLHVVVLAAGRGTRMRSATHKVLHPVGGLPMLGHVLGALAPLKPASTTVVVGDRAAQVEPLARAHGAEIALQDPPRGTGDAVLAARERLAGAQGRLVVLFGDTPLLRPATIARLAAALDGGAALAVLAFEAEPPHRYGRVVMSADGRVERIVEAADARPEELALSLSNAGAMALDLGHAFALLDACGKDNASGELYLTDTVAAARARGLGVACERAEPEEADGVNSRADLARVEALFQRRRRAELMEGGVSLVAPETVFLAHDTKLGADTVVEPFVVFGPGVKAGARCRIRAHSHLEGAELADGVEIGPFARLRPGTMLGEGARIGNFVELKASTLGPGAKANHLAYLGDAEVGAGANIGAGTITCNYDGHEKHRTFIGEGAFIGSNSALVAPVAIGAGALVGAGSTITRDVEPDAVALGRAPQEARAGAARRLRERRQGHAPGGKGKG